MVAIQGGLVGTPGAGAATSGGRLDVAQRSANIGEPIPVVWARRRNGAGGVLISPPATECRFQNDLTNNVTAFYHLVLSEGDIDSIPVKDVFQRSCRVGAHTQTYNRRAGTWEPANVIVERVGYDKPEASYYCGSVGLYPGLSTLSFNVTIPDGFDYWNRQVHVFIRGGVNVTRLYDNTLGPSDNFADLVLWLYQQTRRVPAALISTSAMVTAATFLEVNGFTCNCEINEARNLSTLLSDWAPYFLLTEGRTIGQRTLRPLLPTTAGGAIETGPIDWVYIFTEQVIQPETLEIEYSSLADRQPFVALVSWRQQLEDDFGIIRTAEVRIDGTAPSGPYESHDLTPFCTSENHAVKVGAYIVAKRVFTSHTIRFLARPGSHTSVAGVGDIVRVQLQRVPSEGVASVFDYLYQVVRIATIDDGSTEYECLHFPIDSQGRGLISLAVANATGGGVLLTTNKTGVGCDINADNDNTIPTEEFIEPGDINDPVGETGTETGIDGGGEIVIDDEFVGGGDLGGGAIVGPDTPDGSVGGGGGGSGGGPGRGDGGGPTDPEDNPDDPLEPAEPLGPIGGSPSPGESFLPPDDVCAGGIITRTIKDLETDEIVIQEGVEWSIPVSPPDPLSPGWNNKEITFYVKCPVGPPQQTDPYAPPEFDPGIYQFARYKTASYFGTGGAFGTPLFTTGPGGWYDLSGGGELGHKGVQGAGGALLPQTPWASGFSVTIGQVGVGQHGWAFYSIVNGNEVVTGRITADVSALTFPGNTAMWFTCTWEFSNDGVNVAAEWEGYYLDGFDPDDPIV